MNRTPHQRARDRQIRTLLELWDVPLFDVAALDHATGRMSLREDWDRGQVLHAVGWMARRNATGSSIYARPAESLAAHPWILVDDLDKGAKAAVAEHHPPAAFVETSPDSWQAWIRLDQAVDADARANIGRRLAETHGRAPDRTGDLQLGRCPGFTNQDPDHREEDEQPPFTRLVDVHPEQVVRMETLPFDIKLGITAPVREGGLRPEEVRERAGARDQSRIDFAIACRLVEIGQEDSVIAAVLREVRQNTTAAAGGYIERTISAARRRVEVPERDGMTVRTGAVAEKGVHVGPGLN